MTNERCPCGTQKHYDECCGQYIESNKPAPTPEVLMRTRYTAFAKANMPYIEKTMHGPARKHFDLKSAQDWANEAKWLGLTILEASVLKPTDTVGYVEFIADCEEEGQTYHAHERSRFEKIDSVWYYTDGQSLGEPEAHEHVHSDQCSHGHHHPTPAEKKVKIGRNDPCVCGSGKKFKKCCGV